MGVVMAMYVELFGRDRYYGGMLRESREDEFISNVFGPLRNFEETSWLEELVEKSFDDPAFSNDMANGYDLEFWTRYSCLLYTSDAADDLTRVDLCVRCFIK